MGKQRKACIYARVSSEKGGRDNAVSIGEQVADCTARIRANGDRLVATFIDDARYRSQFSNRMVEPSAKRPDRPGWVQMLATAGKDWDVLYSWRTDRICRGNECAGMFERVLDERRFDVVLVTQQFDRDSFGLLAGGVGGYELRNIAVRLNMGREGRVKAGKHTSRTPYGYRAVRDEAGHSTAYEVTPAGRAFFDRLAALFLDRVSLTEIGRRLGPSRAGKAWNVSSVRHFLLSDFFRGRLVYGRNRPAEHVLTNHAPAHPAAWDAATLAAIDAEWARRDRLGSQQPRRHAHEFLFRGVLRCWYCGRVMACNLSAGRYYTYHCLTRRTDSPHAANTISERKALAHVRAMLGSLTPAAIDAVLDAHQTPTRRPTSVTAVQAELDQLEAQAADLGAALERVRGISPTASQLLERELLEVTSAIAARQGDLNAASVQARELDRATLRAAMLELSANLAHLDTMPRADAARLISRSIPALHAKHGEIVLLPRLR